MSTELSFLIELLLKHKLEADTKDLLAARIREVEATIYTPRGYAQIPTPIQPSQLPNAQSPSTQALLVKHGMASYTLPEPPITIVPPQAVSPPVVSVIAQTPAAQAAIESRNAAMTGKGKHDPNTGRPRKF